jgi:DNA-binding cell septation regulator SpoVG
MKINLDEIQVKIKYLDDKKLKAIITLDFGDFLVKGFRVMESQYDNMSGDKLWLTPPTFLRDGKYHPTFFMPNKDLWVSLEKKIWEEYKKQKNDYYEKIYGLNSNACDIKDEDLPF